jgi:hypothetical protein
MGLLKLSHAALQRIDANGSLCPKAAVARIAVRLGMQTNQA